MITIRVVYLSTGNPMIFLKNPTPDEDDFPFFISEIPDMVGSMCFMGDFTQQNFIEEFRTPDQDIHITREKL